jgi:hypothetical protein
MATYAWPSQEPASQTREDLPENVQVLGGWLQLSAEQASRLAEIDPDFMEHSAQLEQTLAAERETLAALFEDDRARDDEIVRQVERVIEAHAALERRVCSYLVAVRGNLTEAQRAKLFQRCASGVREAGGWQWREQNRERRGPGWGGGGDRGQRRGGGFGRGRGGRFGTQPGRDADVEPTSRPRSGRRGDRP